MESGKVERDVERDDHRTTKSGWKPWEVWVMQDLLSQQLDELKAAIFTYVVLGKLATFTSSSRRSCGNVQEQY